MHFLWRPTLRDPADDRILELAVAANAQYIVTYDTADFKGEQNIRNIKKCARY